MHFHVQLQKKYAITESAVYTFISAHQRFSNKKCYIHVNLHFTVLFFTMGHTGHAVLTSLLKCK